MGHTLGFDVAPHLQHRVHCDRGYPEAVKLEILRVVDSFLDTLQLVRRPCDAWLAGWLLSGCPDGASSFAKKLRQAWLPGKLATFVVLSRRTTTLRHD